MSSPAHSSRYSRTSSSPSPPPAPALSEGAASAHFLRLIGQHRPLGAHRHLNVIPVLVALQTHHQEEDVDGEIVRERLKELYDVEALEDLEEIALAPLFGEPITPLSTPPPDSPRLNSGLQRLPGRTTRGGSAKLPAREFGLPFAQYEHLVAPRRLDPSASLLESSEGELSEEEEAGEEREMKEEEIDEDHVEEDEEEHEEGRSRKRAKREVEKRSARGRRATEERGEDEMDEDEELENEGESEPDSEGSGEEEEGGEDDDDEEEDEDDGEIDEEEAPRRAARKGRASGGSARARKSGGAAKSKTTRAAAAKKPRRSTRR